MKSLRFVLLVFVLMITSGCSHYSGISGKIVDNATGKPIEGALVVAQWTKKHGFGLTNHTLNKITETLTDKEGAFTLSGNYDPFVEPPEMIIYKEGYIPWRNDSIFPSCNLVKENEWNNNVTYKLDIFTDKYTAEQLSRFMNYGIIGLGDAPIFHKIYKEISDRAVDESRAIRDKQQKK
jgi:hypothetical protein